MSLIWINNVVVVLIELFVIEVVEQTIILWSEYGIRNGERRAGSLHETAAVFSCGNAGEKKGAMSGAIRRDRLSSSRDNAGLNSCRLALMSSRWREVNLIKIKLWAI